MKKLLALSFILLSLTSISQDWKMFGSTGELPYAVEFDFTVRDNNRPVVASINSANEVEVYDWNGQEWILMNPVVPGETAEDIDVVHMGNKIYVGFFNTSQNKYQVYWWNGTNWQLFGDPGIVSPYDTGTASLEVSENQTDMFLTYVDGNSVQVKKWNGSTWSTFASDFLPSPYTVKTASEGTKIYAATDVFPGNYELHLWVSGEASGPFSQFGGGTITLDPSYYDIDVNPTSDAGVCYALSTNLADIECLRTNGGGYAFEPTINTSGDIYGMAMAYDANDSMFVAYVDAAGPTIVMWEQGGSWQQVGSEVVPSYNYPVDIEVFDPTNRPFVSTTLSNAPEIRAMNSAPVYNSDVGNTIICQDVGGTVYSSIIFDDADHDSLYVTATSLSTGLVIDPNITISRINSFDPNSPTNEFKIDIVPEAGQSGVASIDLNVTDGLETYVYNISVTIEATPVPTITPTSVLCFGNNDGQIELAGLAASTTYDVTYTMGSTVGPSALTTDTGGSIFLTTLAPGSYTNIIVTSQAGCTNTNAGPVFVSEPTQMVVTAITGNNATLCDGDTHTLTASASGGTPSYTFVWTGISNGVAFTPSVGTGQSIDLTIYDFNGCFIDTNAVIDVNPVPTVPSIIANSPLCEGDDLNLQASSTGGSTYNWTGPNSFISTVQNPTITGVTTAAGGTYSVTATLNGCTSLPGTDIVTVFTNPGPITAVGTDPTACGASDGTLTVSGLSPSTTYDFTYNNAGVQGPFNNTTNTSGAYTFNGLSASTFGDITVTDGNGCSAVYVGPVNLSDPSAPTVGAGMDTTICEGEAITLIADNPDNALISWDNNAINNFTFKPTATTTYTVTASSAGCTSTDQVTVTVNQLPDIAIATTPSTCGSADGSATATINGGATPYTIYWSNGSSTSFITGLNASLYYINVTDANGCYAMDVATVSSSVISVSGIETDVDCYGDETGAINLTASGAGPLTFEWSNGATTEDISGLAAGQYEVRIEDVNGCDASASFVINQPEMIYGTINIMEASCGNADGNLDAIILGGTPSYTFQWKDADGIDIGGETSTNYAAAAAGGYQFEIIDNNGCVQTIYTAVSETGGPIVTVDSVLASTCANDGFINIDVNSSFAISSTTWSSGQTTEDISNVGTGHYSVVVEDANTCKGALYVEVPPVLPDVQPICIVTVDTTTNTNLIIWEKPITDNIDHYRIYRESSIADVFQFVDTVSYSSASEYNDTIAYPALRSWRYQITAVDTCGVESLLSPDHKTIHVTYQDIGGGVYEVYWDEYEGFSYPDFTVWRYYEGSVWTVVNTVTYGSPMTFQETPPSTVGLDYLIEIVPPSTCTSTGKAQDYNSSRSNISTSIGGDAPVDGITELGDVNLSIYPNPSTGIFNLIFEETGTYALEVIDMSGKVIYQNVVTTNLTTIDLSEMADGPYFLKVTNDNASTTTKLVVH